MKRTLASILTLLFCGTAAAEGLLHPLFQDHAVLQRDRAAHVWGVTKPQANVTLEIAGKSASTTADGSGEWHASLPALAAGGPYELRVRSSSGESQLLRDVLIGDVWLCSGQSNMEMPVRLVANSTSEIDAAANDRIRLLTVARTSSAVPMRAFAEPVVWRAAVPDTVRDFSAARFFFGRDLQKKNGVPQGLIHSSWGGSIIQAWISAPALRELQGYDEALRLLDLHERSPGQAESEWRSVIEKWWRDHDPQVAHWSATGLDDSKWSTIRPEGFWETSGIPGLRDFDGIIWFRKAILLSEAQAREDAFLSLGPIDDIDSTWINGRRIGSLEGWNTPRDYRIPRGVLKPGVNVVAVGAFDAGGGGGMWAPSSARRLRLGSGDVPIDGDWRYRIAGTLNQIGTPPHAPWQQSIGTTTLYNAMIAPLAGYTLRGVAWYQGESNSSEPTEYARLLPAMMRDWRRAFGVDLPFLIVQLAGFGPAASVPSRFSWADIREVQRRAVNADGNAALVSAIDIGDRFDIHPGNKQEVGRRLSLAARQLIFREQITGVGPEPIDARRDDSRIVVRFANAAALVVVGGNRPLGFELCDTHKRCRFVDATAERDYVAMDASTVPDAAFVRYAWSNSPVCNLYNDADLPAVPFEIIIQ